MCSIDLSKASARERALFVDRGVPAGGARGATPESDAPNVAPWRVSPQPFALRPQTVAHLERLGGDLLAFYQAANRLYLGSVRGSQPAWVHDYLDRGKSERARELGQLRRTRSHLPRIIRPDLMALEDGTLRATELDSVPGGFGSLAAITHRYHELGFEIVGGASGMVDGLAGTLRDAAGRGDPTVAFVVSDESEDYRDEMEWIAQALRSTGLNAHQLHPRDLAMHGDGLFFEADGCRHRVDVVYRFFELFDIPNIANVDLLIHAMKRRMVTVTAPMKAHLEEKALMALLHHPALETFWREHLPDDVYERLRIALAPTWILDARPIPPTAAIFPPFVTAGRAINRWEDLMGLTQRQRRLVLKPSGFSPYAWGARGVTVGQDVRTEVWDARVRAALGDFETSPHVIQHYHESRRVDVSYFDFAADEVRQMQGRARISPFYFAAGDEVRLGGVLVTVVPAASKVIHGTPEAVLAPAMESPDAQI